MGSTAAAGGAVCDSTGAGLEEPPTDDALTGGALGLGVPTVFGGAALVVAAAGVAADGELAAGELTGGEIAGGGTADASGALGADRTVASAAGALGALGADRTVASAAGEELCWKCVQAPKATRESSPAPAARGIDNSRGIRCIGAQRYHTRPARTRAGRPRPDLAPAFAVRFRPGTGAYRSPDR